MRKIIMIILFTKIKIKMNTDYSWIISLISILFPFIFLIIWISLIIWHIVDYLNKQQARNKLKEPEEEIVNVEQAQTQIKAPSEYYLKNKIFSFNEWNFFKKINDFLINNYNWKYTIFAKVRVWDLVDVKDKRNYTAINKIRAKHIDYIIVNLENHKPILCIELQDNSHYQKKRIERDNFIDDVFNSVWLPILFIRPKNANSNYLNDVLPKYL